MPYPPAAIVPAEVNVVPAGHPVRSAIQNRGLQVGPGTGRCLGLPVLMRGLRRGHHVLAADYSDWAASAKTQRLAPQAP